MKKGLLSPPSRWENWDLGLRHNLLSKSSVASKCFLITQFQQGRVLSVISQVNKEWVSHLLNGRKQCCVNIRTFYSNEFQASCQAWARGMFKTKQTTTPQCLSFWDWVAFAFILSNSILSNLHMADGEQGWRILVLHRPNSPKIFAKRNWFWRLYLTLIIFQRQ